MDKEIYFAAYSVINRSVIESLAFSSISHVPVFFVLNGSSSEWVPFQDIFFFYWEKVHQFNIHNSWNLKENNQIYVETGKKKWWGE